MEITSYDRGIVSYSEYLKNNNVDERYLEKYSWVKSIIIYVIPYPTVTLCEKYLPAKFAYNFDYHIFVKDFLLEEAKKLNLDQYEVLVDKSFLNEKKLSEMANLGFIGKNRLFISNKFGSFCYLGEIVTSNSFDYSIEYKINNDNLCLNCDKCVKACPNGALNDGFDRNLCLSYLSQGASTNYHLFDKMKLYYGCDNCQDVCPYNKEKRASQLNESVVLNLDKYEKILDYKEYAKDKTFNWISEAKLIRNLLVVETNDKHITLKKLEYYKNKYKDIIWLKDHIEYLEKKLEE